MDIAEQGTLEVEKMTRRGARRRKILVKEILGAEAVRSQEITYVWIQTYLLQLDT